MVIQEVDFRLTSIGEADVLWDLELLYTINGKNKETREEFKIAAYGIPLTAAMLRIVNFRINKKIGETPMTMKEYLKEYKLHMLEIKKSVKGL